MQKSFSFRIIVVFLMAFLFSQTRLVSQNINPLELDLMDGFIPCKIYFKDGSMMEGFAKSPYMSTEFVKFKEDLSSYIPKFVSSEELEEIIFTVNNKEIKCKRLSTYRGLRNKVIAKRKSWLIEINFGYMSLLYGKQQTNNNLSQNHWYCMKTNDPAAYYIVTSVTGFMVINLNLNKTFLKNASVYFGDYEELAEKIKNSEYKFKDFRLIVDLYNNWHESK